MAYPQTSAEEIRDLQERNGQLQRLLRRYHASVQAYVALEHPVPQEETAFFEQMLDLLHDTEDLIETGDEAPEHNFAAEAQEATHISDVEQRYYQCDEDNYPPYEPDDEDQNTLDGTWDEEDDPNLVVPEDRSDVVPEWQYKSFDW